MTVDSKRGVNESTNPTTVDAAKQAQMNAVWQRIADKADEQAKVEKKAKLKREAARTDKQKNKLSTAKKIVIIVASVVVLTAIVLTVWFLVFKKSDTEKEPTLTDRANEIANVNTDSSDELSQMIGESQSAYEEYFNEILHTDSTTWTTEDIEKVYYCLAYASKVGLYQDATSLLANIDYAVANGVQVYNGDLTKEFVNSVREQVNNNDAARGEIYEESV